MWHYHYIYHAACKYYNEIPIQILVRLKYTCQLCIRISSNTSPLIQALYDMKISVCVIWLLHVQDRMTKMSFKSSQSFVSWREKKDCAECNCTVISHFTTLTVLPLQNLLIDVLSLFLDTTALCYVYTLFFSPKAH